MIETLSNLTRFEGGAGSGILSLSARLVAGASSGIVESLAGKLEQARNNKDLLVCGEDR